MTDVPQVQVGDQVVYAKQDWVTHVDEYQARVRAVNEDGSLDLQVIGYYNTSHNVNAVRWDPDGKPSTWHLAAPGWTPTLTTSVTTQSGFGSESVSMGGI